MNGYQRAQITLHWIKTKPVDSQGERIPLEVYIKAVCKAKGWEYKPPRKKEE